MARSFVAFPLAAKMAFLVPGPMVDIKLIAMYTTVFKIRAIVRPKKRTQLTLGGWVRVQGMIKFDNPVDPSMPVIEAAKISKIAQPSETYL